METGLVVQDDFLAPVEVPPIDENAELVIRAFQMTPSEFQALKVAERDAIMFVLIREQAASLKCLEMKIEEYEAKARALMTPEGMEEAKKKVMDAMGFGGGMFGGMFG